MNTELVADPNAPRSDAEILRDRARRLAQPLAALVPRNAGLELLSFQLGRERYAIETRYVHATRRASALTPLPMAGAHVLGITNVHGELLVVFDLRVVFGVERSRSEEASHFLLLGDEQAEFAVEVDALESVASIAVDALLEPSVATPAVTRAYLRGVTRTALLVLDGAALLADERLFVDAP